MQANARKAIAPTQFNPMSTRGHCIMMLEVEMPSPEVEGTKQRGRVYVCDLAGTEPAGDIVYAVYNKVNFPFTTAWSPLHAPRSTLHAPRSTLHKPQTTLLPHVHRSPLPAPR